MQPPSIGIHMNLGWLMEVAAGAAVAGHIRPSSLAGAFTSIVLISVLESPAQVEHPHDSWINRARQNGATERYSD